MTSRQVTQYRCDFCGKKKYTKQSMALHELHCTMNPKRECRVCQDNQADMKTIKAQLPVLDEDYQIEDNFFCGIEHSFEVKLPAIWVAANGCPMCIFAAVRQAGFPWVYTDFEKDTEAYLAEKRRMEQEDYARMVAR
jgi:hypothetical protein